MSWIMRKNGALLMGVKADFMLFQCKRFDILQFGVLNYPHIMAVAFCHVNMSMAISLAMDLAYYWWWDGYWLVSWLAGQCWCVPCQRKAHPPKKLKYCWPTVVSAEIILRRCLAINRKGSRQCFCGVEGVTVSHDFTSFFSGQGSNITDLNRSIFKSGHNPRLL